MKLNHFICPNCGHDFYAETAYAACDACRTTFYASQSMTCRPKPDTIYITTQIVAHVKE